MKTDKEICLAAAKGPWKFYTILQEDLYPTLRRIDDKQKRALMVTAVSDCDNEYVFIAHFNPQKVLQILNRQEQFKAKLKEASEFIQKLGPTIDYDIIKEIKELLND